MQTITFYTRSVYGRTNIYIANEEQARTVSTLTGRTCVTNADLNALSKLGCSVEQVPDPKSVVVIG